MRKMVSVIRLLFFSAILTLSESTSGVLRVVYVSKARGNTKTASCGSISRPCKTLELGFDKLAWKGKLYVDGKDTDKDPYTCKLCNSSKKELEIQKSFTLLSYANSTARISCPNGIVIEGDPARRPIRKMRVNVSNVMFVDSKRLWVKDEINITLNNVIFNNTKLQLKNAWSVVQNCSFQKSYPAIEVYISNTLPFYELKVKNTLFKENCGCIEINQGKKAKGCNRKILLSLQDILFQGNTILMTRKPKSKESGLVSLRGSNNCLCKNMSFFSKWKNVTVIDNQGHLNFCNKTQEEKQKGCCWKRKEKPNEFTRSIFAVHACRVSLRFLKVKSMNNVNTRFLMSRSGYNTIKVQNSSYQGHGINNPGGVIHLKGQGAKRVCLTIVDSTFFNNSGTLGGVLQVDGGESKIVELNMVNVSFLHSYGSDFGCVVSVAKVNYNHRSSLTHAAKIFAYLKRLLVEDTRFSYNQTSKEHHYAAFCFAASHLSYISIKESLFKRNDVPALTLRHESTNPSIGSAAGVKIERTDFIENYSPRDRENAVLALIVDPYSVKKSSLNFSRTNFTNNNGTAVMAKHVIYVRAIRFTCAYNLWICMLMESKIWLRKVPSLNSTLIIQHSVFTHNLNSPIRFIHKKPRFLQIQILNTSFHKNHYRAALSIHIGFQKQNNTLISGKLQIKNTNFTSNSVAFASTHVLRVILMVPTNAKFKVLISKTAFKNNVQHHYKGYVPEMSSMFFFYMPEDFEFPKGKKCKKYPHFNYTLRKRSFSEVVFENNTGSSSMLYISNGLNSFYRCIFKNSFAKHPRSGAHVFVEEGTARVLFHKTKFEQTKFSSCKPCNDNPCNHSSRVLPFVYAGARGPLIICNSSFTLHASERKTKMFIIQNGRFVRFDSRTKLRCPIGSYINIENSSHVIRPMFTRDHCPLNITRMRFVCEMCPVSTYSLQRGSFNGLLNKTYIECFDCPYGGNCAWNIKSKHDFWGYLSSPDPPRLRFVSCPEHYCRVPKRSTNTSVYNRCSGNRTGLMCGACKEGFTESMFNHECRPIGECRDGWFWAIAVLYLVIMGVYILLRPPIATQLVKKIMWFRKKTPSLPHRAHEQAGTTDGHGGHGYSKVIFYFYQVADLLMLESSFQILRKEVCMFTLISFYNFEVEVADSSFGCPFPGLTSVTKELFRSLQVFAVMVFLLVLYFLHWLLWVIRRKPRPHFAPYLAAIIEVLLLGYERLAHTSFNLLQCTALNIDGQKAWKMFIDGNITCWVHWWQFAMIAYNIVFVIPFMLVLLVGTSKLQRGHIGPFLFLAACFVPLPFLVYWLLTMKRMKVRRLSAATGEAPYQQYTKHFLEVIQGPFRPPKDQSKGALYWESILIGRRLVLLCLHSLVPSPMLRILSMTFVCLLILLHDVVIMPFKDRKTNALAAFLLCIHVVLGAINLAKATLINAGVSPKGPPKTQMYGLQRLEISLLGILPCAFLLLVATCVVSQTIRLIVKAGLYISSKLGFQEKSGFLNAEQGHKTGLEESCQPLLDPTMN